MRRCPDCDVELTASTIGGQGRGQGANPARVVLMCFGCWTVHPTEPPRLALVPEPRERRDLA